MNLPYEIQCLRAECPKDFDLTLVLDQFEQWLGGIRQLKRQARRQAQEDFRDVIRSRHKQKLRVTIVIRKEWLSELRFLGELVPPLANLVEITGPPVDDTEDATLEALANRLSTACAIDLAEAHEIIRRLDVDGRFLPLEAQLVGATLERERRMSRNISTQDFDERLHGVGGCIENYFETLLASSNDRRVTTKVLCSLSARTRFRQKEDYSDILRAVYEEKSAVDRAVEELRAAHVVVSRGIDHIELAHDYLAEFFYAKSGTELNPIERDNIFYHLESARQDQPSILVDEVRGEALPRPIGRYVVTTLLTIMVVRFINLGLPWIRFGPDLTRPLFGNMFDVAYLPILIAQGIWIAYAGRFHDAVFRFVKEDALARATSRFVVYNLVLSIAVGLFSFYAWWLGIVTGGLVLALKILLLSRRRDLSFAAVDRLRNFGFITLFNMVFLGILAVSYLVVGPAFAAERTGQDATIVASTIASLMLTYGCIALASAHVTKAGVSQLLGLIGRPKRAPIPRPDVS